jgi:hypothetical protein
MGMDSSHGAPAGKLGAEFAGRLARLAPQTRVRAVLVLETGHSGGSGGTRQSPGERKAALEAVRGRAGEAIPEIDRILAATGGRRLESAAGAFGNLLVEATAQGVLALAASEQVRCVLEDQGLVRQPPEASSP